MNGSQLKNVCLSVVCPSVVPNYFLNPWSDWDKKFCTKNRENEDVKILILELRDHCPRVKPLV
jgi:hypothetical protein